MKKVHSLVASLALVATLGAAGLMTVTFDPATGQGFVGRGDIISSLGRQALGTNLTFEYQDLVTYQIQCEKWVGGQNNQRLMERTRERTRGVEGSVDHDTRTNRNAQITGYILTGYTAVSHSGGPLQCDGNDPNDLGWTMVGDPIEIASVGLGLTVNGVPLAF